MITVVFSTEGFSEVKSSENSSLNFSCLDNKSICDLKNILASKGDNENVGQLFKISFDYLNTKKLFNKSIRDFKSKLASDQYESIYLEFHELIKRKMLSTAKKKKDQFISNLVIKKISSDEKTNWVRLEGNIKDKKTFIDLEVVKNSEKFEIQDLTINSVSLSRTYQGQFNKIFRIEGYVGLISRLRDKNSKK
jgi:ABC-type transporter MlaC component